jgi:hypothetical protein
VSEERSQKYVPPEATTDDLAVTILKAAVKLVPGGDSALDIIQLAIGPPLERRTEEWMREVAQGLRALDVQVDELGRRVELLDTFLQATRVAISTASEIKRRALRNAVLNVAAHRSGDAPLRDLLLRLIEQYTPLHLQVLSALADLDATVNASGLSPQVAGVQDVIVATVPAARQDSYSFGMVWRDLVQAKLIEGGTAPSIPVHIPGRPRPSGIGTALLALIHEPPEKEVLA